MSNRLGPRTRLLGSGASARVSQWFQRSVVRSVQRGTIAITGATSNTATITSVDVGNSRLRLLSSNYNATGSARQALVRIALTNATTITATVNTSPAAETCTASFEIIEYWPGVIRSVQRGTIAVAGTATIAAVNTAKAELDYLGCEDNSPSIAFNLQTYVVLTNGTTVTAFPGTNSAQVTGFQVVEWF